MYRLTIGFVFLFTLMVSFCNAEDAKKTTSPQGKWKKDLGNGNYIQFNFHKKNAFKANMKAQGNTITVFADYGISKDSVLFGRINKVDSTSGGGPNIGELFSFTFQIKKDQMTISNLIGTDVGEEARQAIQGDYSKE